ncbi:MAG: type II secretion system minor pseudopilin GspI [Gammaproteobacteria bacterium]|nr:type II secretion system minor pseudopilin GspI [Gammaproteobacteria bacterium]
MSLCRHSKQTVSGFTLIEILVALVIIAVALGALIKASSDHTFSASYLKQKTIAHWVAMNELTLLQVEKKWPDLGSEKKHTDMADHQWFWTREVLELPDLVTGEPSQQVRQVLFTVYLDEDRQQQLTRLTGYLERP